MYRTMAIVLVGSAFILASVTGETPSKSAPSVRNICVVDGVNYRTIQSAISECRATGAVAVPATFNGTDSYENHNSIPVWDLRHPESVKGLTPVTDFGVRGDASHRADGASQNGSDLFISASASFDAGRDEGKAIVITGAGAENASLTTTIKGVSSPTQVTLAVKAGFTATGLTYWYGTDNTSALQTAYDSLKPLFLPPGKYLMTGTVKGSIPLFLIGSGSQSVIINDTNVFHIYGTVGPFLDNFRMESATKLTALPPNSFPTPHAGTPVAVDRIGSGVGYQPELQDLDIWDKVSKQQQAQQIGPTFLISADETHIYRITGDLVRSCYSTCSFPK